MIDTSASEDLLGQSVRAFIAATAAKTPTPGGGSVAALAGALAAALGQMALAYTVGKKQFAESQGEIAAAIEKLGRAGALMEELVAEDMAAYVALSAVLKMPAAERAGDPRYLPAVVAAIRAPQTVGGVALQVLEMMHALRDKCTVYLLSDLGAAAALAQATVQIAELNVRANVRLLPNAAEAAETRRQAEAMSRKADGLWQQVREQLRAKM